MKMRKPSHYQSYLLRLWRDNARDAWQASLQSTASEQVHHFPDVDRMWAFLQAQLGIDVDEPEAGDTPAGEPEPRTPG
jgi:hypothetical protein